MTNSDTELSDFTKLVLARLETNPDEFQLGGRWDTLVRGLEAHAINETESRYLRTLWPLTAHELATILEAYRKAYLARLHKDMLKNIVSGDDLPKTLDPIKGTLRGASPSTVLTASAMQQQTLGLLQKEFDKSYKDAFSNAIVKGEGQTVQMSDTNTAYKYIAKEQREKVKKILITPSDHKIAKKLGIDVLEYIKRRDAA